MTVTGTSALTNEVKAVYDGDFYMAGQSMLYWDQFSDLRIVMEGQRGRTYNFPIVENNQPNTGALDELNDIVPQQMQANEIQVSLNEYGGAIEVTKLASATAYADVYKQAAYVNGYNLAESYDLVVRAVAGQGGRQFFQGGRTARSGFDGQGTTTDRLTTAFIEFLTTVARMIKMPLYEDGTVCTVMHPFPWYDLLQQSSVRDMSTRQVAELLFNGEVAYWGGMRIILSSNAKAFYGAGAAISATLSTTLSLALNAGDATAKIASVTSAAVGQRFAIVDAAETGNTWSDTNELVQLTRVGTLGASGTGVDFFAFDPGPGDNGGARYAHASGTTFLNNNSVYPIVVLGPTSITKAASGYTGPYGETVVTGPFDRLGRFLTFGWYSINGWTRTRSGWLLRGEVGSSSA